jgi:hypothetical protein
MSQFPKADNSSEQPAGQKGVRIGWPLIGMAICACLFIVEIIHLFFTMFTGPWEPHDPPWLGFMVLASVVGFVGCLIWMMVVLIASWRKK